jgi:hypothetical protein
MVEISRSSSVDRSMVKEGYFDHGLLVCAQRRTGGLATDAFRVRTCRHAIR